MDQIESEKIPITGTQPIHEKRPMIFDTHGHYDDERFDEDRKDLLGNMEEKGVQAVVTVGASVETSKQAAALSAEYETVYAAVGVHPDHVGELEREPEKFQELESLAMNKKVVAIGEIGLDYHWDVESHEIQKKWFVKQLKLAKKRNLPVNIHSREASEDTFRIIKEYGKEIKGIIHCFSGSKELALEYIKLGYSIGIGGVVTFKNGKKLKQVVEGIPLTSIVLETDCPYLAPEPNRGKRNESKYIQFIAEEIAKLKEVSVDEVLKQTKENAKQIYQIK